MQRRVLHADAHADTRQLLAYMLAIYGVEVVEAADGHAACAAAVRHRPDAIVSELVLPGLSGIDVARTVRDTPSLRDVPLIAWTGRTDAASHRAATAAGFNRVLVKAVDLDIVGEILRALGVSFAAPASADQRQHT